MFENLEFTRRKRDSGIAKLNYSTKLGQVAKPIVANKVTTIVPTARPELNRGTMPTLVNGYSTSGFDINPFDLAYRADTREEYLIDFGVFLVRIAAAAGGPGGAAAVNKTTISYILGMLTA